MMTLNSWQVLASWLFFFLVVLPGEIKTGVGDVRGWGSY